MKTILSTVAFVLVSTLSATAQTTPGTSTSPVVTTADHECIMATDAQAWASLGLSPDQTKRVQEIQTTCKKECAAMKASGSKDATMDKAMTDKHEAQIKSVLTPDQYNKWVAWCASRPTTTEKKMDMKN